MKYIFLFIFIFLQSLVFAQKKYHSFLYQGKYGLTDTNNTEILPPDYDKYLDDTPQEFVFSKNVGSGVILDKKTGEITVIDFLDENKIYINEKYFRFVRTKDKSFLANTEDYSERKIFDKPYHHIINVGRYIIAYKTTGFSADIIDDETLQPLFSDFEIKEIGQYFANDNMYFIVINDQEIQLIDEDFIMMNSQSGKFESLNEAQHFFEKNMKVQFQEPPSIVEEQMMTAALETNGIYAEEYNGTIEVTVENTDGKTLFFSMGNPEHLEFYAFRGHGDHITFYKNDAAYHLIHVDTKTKKIFIPKKYWAALNIQLK